MGDFSAHFHRPDSGINTIEGNVAGSRAALLTKKRQREQDEFAKKKELIEKEHKRSALPMKSKFEHDSSLSATEKTFKMKTIGLVTADEFKRATEEAERAKRDILKDDSDDEDLVSKKKEKKVLSKEELKAAKKARKKKLKEKRKMMSTLSFANDEEVEDDALRDVGDNENNNNSQEMIKKNPNVNTAFLPDKQRDYEQKVKRKQLEKEWKIQQEEIKKEKLDIIYSYWDGTGHRRNVQIIKGNTIQQFLEVIRKDLSKEFRELQNISSDDLLYIKEDLILPSDITFYDLIATKARGKSGPLFHFDIKEDIRVGAIDSRIEKDESHPGKIVLRKWYDRNKHIFPASRWEVYDPSKEYGTYTIHGREVN